MLNDLAEATRRWTEKNPSVSSPIYDCQAEDARARARAMGFMVEETLAKSKLSTGQHIQNTSAKVNHTARSVTP